MSVEIKWLDVDKTIMFYEIDGKWTWQEFLEADKPIWEIIENADHRIDLIIDFSNVESFPPGITEVWNDVGMRTDPDDGDGLIIVIGGPAYVKILYGLFRRIYPKAVKVYRLIDTFEGAIQLLEQERDESIELELAPFE